VGFGSIPKMLVPILHAAGASVLYTATEPKEGSTEIFRRLPELLKQSDIVSLHVPLTPTSAGMIGREQLASMRPGSILINTARGGLVDSAALAEALKSGHIGAAGLDVFATEPVSPTDPLLALENVVLAPHVAWLTTGTLERSLAIAVENCTRLNDGNFLLHRVV
jgi:phosphoglycerate dehydrogenase-like enzyme